MKVWIMLLVFWIAKNVEYRFNHRHRHRMRSLKKYQESPEKGQCDQNGPPQGEYEYCRIKSGRVAKIQGFKGSFGPNDPVTIVSKNMYAELNIYDLIIYADSGKKMKIIQNGLTELKRIIWPRSFRQEGYQVNCFQLDFESKKCVQQIEIDDQQLEPSDGIQLGLCFTDESIMKEWMNAIVAFRNGCEEERERDLNKHRDDQMIIKKLNEMQGMNQLDYMEGQVNNLLNQAMSLKKSLETIEKNKDKIKASYELHKIGESGRTKLMEQDKAANEAFGYSEECDKSKEAKGTNKNKPCKKPPQDLDKVLQQEQLSYEDIDKDDSLSVDEKRNKRNDRLKEWQEIMAKKTPKRMDKKKQSIKDQLQPIKDLLNQLITIQQKNKKKHSRNQRR